MAVLMLIGRDDEDRKQYAWFHDSCYQALYTLAPGLDIRVFPDFGNTDDIEFVIVLRHPLGMLKRFKNLKFIASLAAGVDHILNDPDLPLGVPIVRIKDPNMAQDISHYVLANVLYYAKRLDYWAFNQQQHLWLKKPPFQLTDKTVGLMGMGYLGLQAALMLKNAHLNVIGWSSSKKDSLDIKQWIGNTELDTFLEKTHFLVCLLPLTTKTQNILNANVFPRLPKGAYLIHLGRGEQLVEADLLAALDSGQLAGACLDVFRQEPLPTDHPFWRHPLIRITPHVASVTDPATAIPQILANYDRYLNKQPLLNEVDRVKGY